MRSERIVLLVILAPFTALTQNLPTESQFVPPAYKIMRFDEDYSYFSNSTNRTDWSDPIKYIPIRNNAPDWYLTLGGELRERFEGNYNPNFGIGNSDANSYWMQRISFLSDVHLGKRFRVFAEGISGVIEGEHSPAPKVQNDPIDLQFAFADFIPYLADDEKLTLRGGRFGMSFGSGRLVANRAAPNIPFRFDGCELIYDRPLWKLTGFVTRPVEDNGVISGSNPGIYFWGFYVTHWFDAPQKNGIDLYYIGYAEKNAKYSSGTGDENRHSFGTRFFGAKSGWDWNGEGIIQVGTFGNESILAWTASLDSGYTWDTKFQPRLGLKVDAASGDSGKNKGQLGTFNALYFKSGYFNDASLIRPENLVDVHPNLSANLTRKLTVDGGADVFWRYSHNDAIYGPPGFIAIPAKAGSAYIGTALDLNLEWHLQKHLTFGASYVHFLTSNYVTESGGKDVNYVSTTLSFVF